jgi:cyclopropane-fatty-acyl-phospholipid synthase
MTASDTPGPAERLVTELMATADIRVGGNRPWDITVHDERFFHRLIRHGQLGIGEAYMDGWWDCDRIDEMSARFIRANLHHESSRDPRFISYYLKQRLKGIGRKSLAYQVGEAHYNLSNELFAAFLDDSMSYSCAYWRDAETLEEAQRAKLDLVCRKLNLQPGMKVLEIGCGWGGWARHAAQQYGVEVLGITVSKEQLAWARERSDGLPLRFELTDYRDVTGEYDRVVSIAMFEAVGQRYFRTFMKVANRVLKPGGQVLLHTIIGNTPIEAAQARWLNTYIFPNGEMPSLSQVYKAAEGLFVAEAAHHLDGDYARTLAEWDRRFVRNWPRIERDFDQRFYRMWRFYLQISQGIFKSRLCHLWQFVFSKDGIPGLDVTCTANTYPHADAR